tara:strand:- start:88 stop:219 length:132 start_codon:yes stop_codon:yes gene_type:complete
MIEPKPEIEITTDLTFNILQTIPPKIIHLGEIKWISLGLFLKI